MAMRENYTLIRLYLDADFAVNTSIELSKDHRHYVVNVLRKGEGDELRVFNGAFGEWRARITGISKKSAQITVLEQLCGPNASPDIMLCFAPVRKHRTAFIIEKATELGVSVLQPVITARTQFPKINPDKIRAQIIEAAEQTERLDIPQLNAAVPLEAMLNELLERTVFFADEAGDARPALETIRAHKTKAAILIGPEGGFTPQERESLRARGNVVPISLGPRILRADTAALSVLTLWQSVHGDWSE